MGKIFYKVKKYQVVATYKAANGERVMSYQCGPDGKVDGKDVVPTSCYVGHEVGYLEKKPVPQAFKEETYEFRHTVTRLRIKDYSGSESHKIFDGHFTFLFSNVIEDTNEGNFVADGVEVNHVL